MRLGSEGWVFGSVRKTGCSVRKTGCSVRKTESAVQFGRLRAQFGLEEPSAVGVD